MKLPVHRAGQCFVFVAPLILAYKAGLKGLRSRSQGVVGLTYVEERHDTGMAGPAVLPVYWDLLRVTGLPESIGRHRRVKQRGLTDARND